MSSPLPGHVLLISHQMLSPRGFNYNQMFKPAHMSHICVKTTLFTSSDAILLSNMISSHNQRLFNFKDSWFEHKSKHQRKECECPCNSGKGLSGRG